MKIFVIFVMYLCFLCEQSFAQKTSQSRVTLSNGLDEYHLFLFQDKDKNGLRAFHEPLFYFLEHSDHAGVFYEIKYGLANHTNLLNIYFVLTTDRIKDEVRNYFANRNENVTSVDPVYPARIVAVLKNKAGKKFKSVQFDPSAYDMYGKICFLTFQIPYSQIQTVENEIKRNEFTVEIYYAYPSKDVQDNTVSYQHSFLFPDYYLDSIFKQNEVLQLTQEQLNQLMSVAKENVEIYGYFSQFDEKQLDDFLQNISLGQFFRKNNEVYDIKRSDLEEIQTFVSENIKFSNTTSLISAIRTFSDNHIYVQNLNPTFFHTSDDIQKDPTSEKFFCDILKSQQGSLTVNILNGKLQIYEKSNNHQFLFPLEDCEWYSFHKNGEMYNGYVFSMMDSNVLYTFLLDKNLMTIMQDIEVKNEYIIHMTRRNIFIRKSSDHDHKYERIYSSPRNCDFLYGQWTDNRLKVQTCNGQEVIEL